MRLDKFLGHANFGSRTEVKALIKEKRVFINDRMAKKGDEKIDVSTDCVTVNGEKVHYKPFAYYMLHKPQGVISATEDGRHQTVLDLLNVPDKGLFPVGRLDKDTEGLLILTNDGQLGHHLTSPKHHIDKVYEVRVENPIDPEVITVFANGVIIDGNEQCRPAQLTILSDTHCYLTIHEGKFHQVKRMFKSVNNRVLYLKRIAMGNLQLDSSLKLGQFRELTAEEIAYLKQSE